MQQTKYSAHHNSSGSAKWKRSCLGLLLAGAVIALAGTIPAAVAAEREMEHLQRGVVAVPADAQRVFVSWRLLGTEPADLAFDLYRSDDGGPAVKLNTQPLSQGTCFVDTTADRSKANAYVVRVAGTDAPPQPGDTFTLAADASQPYLSVPLQTPPGYTPNDCSVGDLDGDGQYEIIVHQAGRGHDNSQAGPTDPPILQAYTLSGKLLWTIHLGRNIREGAHYTQFVVYDLDGDGRAEVVCKTADGTIDGVGNVIGDPNANYVNEAGYILKGPEYLTVFDGLTGKALTTTKYIPGRHPATENPTGDQLKAEWGDAYGNRVDRFLACVAYLDGVHPSVVMCRGYYTRTVLAAWDWRDGKLTSRWVFDTDSSPELKRYAGQGNHNLSVADVDGDGKDEIIYGAMCIDDDGKGLYSTGLGHGDALHVSDLDPGRPGLEVFDIHEHPRHRKSIEFRDARTGETIWSKPGDTQNPEPGPDVGRGVAFDVDPRYPGAECWSAGAGLTGKVFDCKGNLIAEGVRLPINMSVYWDGDLLSELLDGTVISKWDYLNQKCNTLLDAKAYGCVSNNGTKANPCLSADILGDWREEVIWRTEDGKELRIFTTTIPTDRRMYTLMHDPQYRQSIAWQNVAYNQPPHTSFYIGPGMSLPPRPQIRIVGSERPAK